MPWDCLRRWRWWCWLRSWCIYLPTLWSEMYIESPYLTHHSALSKNKKTSWKVDSFPDFNSKTVTCSQWKVDLRISVLARNGKKKWKTLEIEWSGKRRNVEIEKKKFDRNERNRNITDFEVAWLRSEGGSAGEKRSRKM